MLKFSHTTLIYLSGFIWLAVGCFLLPLGLNFVVESLLPENASLSHPILNFLGAFAGGMESAALVWIALALLIGFIKGNKVFSKSVDKSVTRILSLPNPAPLTQIYTPAYYVLLGSMVLLGFLVRFTPQDIRGGVDIVVGSALIHGAMLYFRKARQIGQVVFERVEK